MGVGNRKRKAEIREKKKDALCSLDTADNTSHNSTERLLNNSLSLFILLLQMQVIVIVRKGKQ